MLRSSKPVWWQNWPLWVILSQFGSDMHSKKLENSKNLLMYQLKNEQGCEISPKMRYCGGKRSVKMSIWWLAIQGKSEPDFGRKDGKTCKMTKIAHFELNPSHFGGKICHCGSFWVNLWCEMVLKSWKTQKICWCTPPDGMKDSVRFLQKWDTLVAKDGKSCESGEISHSEVNLSLILGEKMEKPAKWPKLAILSQSKPLFWQNLPLWVILSHFSVKWCKKVEKLKKIADVPPQESKSVRFLQKWDTVVVKDGKSCESRWLAIQGKSEPDFGGKDGKTCKMTKIGYFEPI